MRVIADFHTHTIASGHAFNTVEELVQAARKRGIKYLAITDHGPKMPGGPHEYYFYNMKVLPERMHGVRLLKGIEANIISSKGELDLDEYQLRILDLVIASSHEIVTPENLGIVKNTKMLLKVLENKYVDVLGHLENPKFPVNIPQVVGAAKEASKIVEINNASFTVARKGSYEACVAIMKEIKQNKMLTMINSDAHIGQMLGEISTAWKVAEEVGIKREQVINFSKELTEKFIANKKNKF